MKVDGNVERFCAFQDWPEEFVVQVATPDMAVDHGSLEAVLMNRALQLDDGCLRIRSRQASKSGKAGGISPDCLCDAIVGFPGNCSCRSRVELFGSRRGKRQHLHINPCGIHLRDSLLAKIGELLNELCKPIAKSCSSLLEVFARPVQKSRGRVMLFKGDGSHD